MRISKISPGYNIVESSSLPELPDHKESVGFIEFLRILKSEQRFESSLIEVRGLDSFVLESEDLENTCNLIRKVLWKARDNIPSGLIVIFPVNAELRDHNPRLFKDGKEAKEVDLKYIFGNRIEKVTSSISFAPFYIQP